MMKQVVVGNLGKVGKLVVIDVHGKTLFYLLLDVVVHYGVGLTRLRHTEHHRGAERIDHIDPAVVPFFLIIKTCG